MGLRALSPQGEKIFTCHLFAGIKLGIAVLIHRKASMNVDILPLAVTLLPDTRLLRLMRVSNSLSVEEIKKRFVRQVMREFTLLRLTYPQTVSIERKRCTLSRRSADERAD
jgi:hypothetical protein